MDRPNIDSLLDVVAEQLRKAKRVLFITGAGISAESGLPTYRGVGGLYNDQKTEEGFSIEACLSASMFRVKPEITWKYMLPIGEAVGRCKPNAAHETIAAWEKIFEQKGGKLVVLTQNIDGYHKLAGSKNVLEIHGSLRKLICTECDWTVTVEDDGRENERFNNHLTDLHDRFPPRCPKCQAVIRPDIVLFEEMLPRHVLDEFDREFMDGNGFDIIFSVGTSSMFPYIYAPVLEAARAGKFTVEINPEYGELSSQVSVYLPLKAAEALRELQICSCLR